MRTLLDAGICECVYEPRCSNGLEGYQRGDEYIFKKILNDGKKYYKIYLGLEYYETCGVRVFNKFFKIKRSV
jgi:hypothetical protein